MTVVVHEHQVFQLGQRFRAAVAQGAAGLFQNRAFARDSSLRNKQVGNAGQTDVRRNTVPRRKQDDVSHHQLFCRNLNQLTPAADGDAFMNQTVQLLRCIFRPKLLNQPDGSAD